MRRGQNIRAIEMKNRFRINDMRVKDFDYELPEKLIAQKPADKRDNSRLMVIHRSDGSIEHRHFYDILDYLNTGDCLVLNNSKVLPARLYGVKKSTGANIEFLLVRRIGGDKWETLVKPGRRVKIGDVIEFSIKTENSDASAGNIFEAEVLDYGDGGTRIVEFHYDGIFMQRLAEIGKMPLPPYISRPSDDDDRDRYQTVYCRPEGSVAAPTAGLHFTEKLLAAAEVKGVKLAYVTLHVGIGTFRPVKVDLIEDHKMHFEEYYISKESAETINSAKKLGGRIIAVGTTSVRTVESAAAEIETDIAGIKWTINHGSGRTGIFIYPGYEFKIVDSLITNFHLPKSTLLMLVSALYNRGKILEAYEEAVAEKYRFFSYGDAMLIE